MNKSELFEEKHYSEKKNYDPKKTTLYKKLKRHYGLTENTKEHRAKHIKEITKNKKLGIIEIVFNYKERIYAEYKYGILTYYHVPKEKNDKYMRILGVGEDKFEKDWHTFFFKKIKILATKSSVEELIPNLSKKKLSKIRKVLVAKLI